MMKSDAPEKIDGSVLSSIFHECRQCGTCCRKYRKVLLEPEEVDFIKKMGAHVGMDLSLRDLRDHPMEEVIASKKKTGRIYMIHPDDKGCIFLENRNGKYYCRIYHYRPKSCRGFRCNLADKSFMDLFGGDAIHLLGQNRFGQPL